jgi:uncharacterized membrane protein
MFPTTEFHPMLVHFPIALLLLGLLADLSSIVFRKEACLSRAGLYLLVAGTLFAIPTVLSGILFTAALSGEAGDLKEKHETFALVTLGAAIVTSAFRIYLVSAKKEGTSLKWPALALYVITSGLVAITGYLGGTLVYRYMMPL